MLHFSRRAGRLLKSLGEKSEAVVIDVVAEKNGTSINISKTKDRYMRHRVHKAFVTG